jgi:acetyl-CoA acetyltransferase
MAEAYIVAAVRTAGGRRNGKLKDWHPADLAGQVINELLDRSGADPESIEDVAKPVSRRQILAVTRFCHHAYQKACRPPPSIANADRRNNQSTSRLKL